MTFQQTGTIESLARKIGIMGGTFDPIHFGHLVTAEAALASFDLEQVIFVPSGKPPHKKDYPVTEAEARYLMTIMAVATNARFRVSRMEIDRPGYSYAIDTVKGFRELFGPQTELYFITGADAILEILTWKNVEKLLGLCHFIAATRPGFDLHALDQVLDKLPALKGRLHFLEVPALAISSSDIRKRVAEGRPIKYLLPETVEHYIYKTGLYQDRKQNEEER
ncbi:MAG: nicotinate-nucleotide adenylyltransferase [Clostridia bacterium]|nr:nicotinate-nucleotide adenylyltransferase [Clostridia bacterium]